MKLYTHPKTRGAIIEWYIKELGLKDVEFVQVDFEQKAHKQDDYLKVHPFGRLPALTDGDLTLFESGAILLYLAEKYGALDTTEKRAKAEQWIFFANTTLVESAVNERTMATAMPEVLGALNKMLSGHDFIEGDAFTVSDVALGSVLYWLPMIVPEFKLAPYPNVAGYLDRMKARPGFEVDPTSPSDAK